MVLQAQTGISQTCPWQIFEDDLVSFQTTKKQTLLAALCHFQVVY